MSLINESLLEPEVAILPTPLTQEDEQTRLLYSIAVSLRGIHDILRSVTIESEAPPAPAGWSLDPGFTKDR